MKSVYRIALIAALAAYSAPAQITWETVGTTATQTLTNKTIDGDDNTLRDIPQSAVTDLTGDLAKKLGGETAEALTITGGAITITKTHCTVAGEGAAADDLATINGGVAGTLDILLLRPFATAQDITIKHATGNIRTHTAADYTIPDSTAVLLAYDGTGWILIGDGGGTPTAAEVVFTPSGNIEATDAQSAIEELDTEKQASDAELAALSGLTFADDKMIIGTGAGTVGMIDCTTFAQSILDDTDEATFKSTVNLEIGTDIQAYDAQLADIAALAVADGNIIVGDGTNWVAESGATARTSLGLAIGTNVQAYSTLLADIAGLTLGTGDMLFYDGANLAIVDATGASDGDVPAVQADGSIAFEAQSGTGAGTYVEIANATQYFSVSFTIPDEPDNDPQHFQIEIDNDADFSSPIVDHDSRDAGDGGDGQTGCEYFNGTQFAAWTSGTGVISSYEGNRGVYYFQSGSINRGTIYYVRIRFHDGTAWGDYAGEVKTW